MYSAEGSKRMNYYVPNGESPSKKCNNISTEPRRAVRILGKRYALTSTSYKYLDIGISVGTMSYVELLLGDNRGNQLILPFATWQSLMHKRADIEQLVHSTAPPLWIQDLSIEVVKISGSKIVKLTLSNNCLYMQPQTLFRLFDFEDCIDHMHLWLCQNTYIVNEKFKQFVAVLQRNNIANADNAIKAIRESDAFDGGSLIDCELLTCAVNDVLYAVCNK